MADNVEEEQVAYDCHEGAWVPVDPDSQDGVMVSPAAEVQLASQSTEQGAQLKKLMEKLDALNSRIDKLERRLDTVQRLALEAPPPPENTKEPAPAAEAADGGSVAGKADGEADDLAADDLAAEFAEAADDLGVATDDDLGAEFGEELAGAAGALEDAPPADAAEVAPEPATPEAEAAPAGEAIPEVEPRTGPELKMPAPSSVIEMLGELIEGAVASPYHGAPPFEAQMPGYYFVTLDDDGGQTVGAMVADARCVAQMGGRLMAMEEDEIIDGMIDGLPCEDMIDGMGEVFNTLNVTVNKVPGNVHVRPSQLVPWDVSKIPWMLECANRLDLQDCYGGKMAFVAR